MLVWACIGDERVNVSGCGVNAQTWATTKPPFCLYLTDLTRTLMTFAAFVLQGRNKQLAKQAAAAMLLFVVMQQGVRMEALLKQKKGRR